MKIYNESIAFQSKKPRETLNITARIKAAVEKSAAREGIVLICSQHSNTAVILSEDEPGLTEDLESWLEEVAPVRDEYKHHGRFESNAAVHFRGLLLRNQVVVPFTEAVLDLSPSQAILFVELDGLRPRRIILKVLGE